MGMTRRERRASFATAHRAAAAASPQRIELHVESLVLEGVPRHHADLVADSLRRELTASLTASLAARRPSFLLALDGQVPALTSTTRALGSTSPTDRGAAIARAVLDARPPKIGRAS